MRLGRRGWAVVILYVGTPTLLAALFVGLPVASGALLQRPLDQPVVTGAFGCANVDRLPPDGRAVRTSIVAVQVGRLPGFERVIVTYRTEVPEVAVTRTPMPVFATRTQTGDAYDVRLGGRTGLAISSTWAEEASLWDGRSVGQGGPTIVEGRLWNVGDQQSLVGLGLSRDAPFRVATFSDPARAVVDVAAAPASCTAT